MGWALWSEHRPKLNTLGSALRLPSYGDELSPATQSCDRDNRVQISAYPIKTDPIWSTWNSLPALGLAGNLRGDKMWLDICECGKFHWMMEAPCPQCGTGTASQIVSAKIRAKCGGLSECHSCYQRKQQLLDYILQGLPRNPGQKVG